MNSNQPPSSRLLLLALLVLTLTGCARVDFEESLARTNRTTAEFTGGNLALAQTDEQRAAMTKTAATLLARPLSQQDAVHLALVNSPAIQAMLARNWAEAARAAQSGRIANPWFVFARTTLADEVEFERALTFGLLDLLTLPLRYPAAQGRIELARVRLALDTVDTVTTVRRVWVRAVAARERLVYAQQVYEVGEISAELARRLQQVGNFSRLQYARQQAFYADAATRLAASKQDAVAAREELVRVLGLSESQEKELQLPERLPDLPDSPRGPEEVSAAARAARLDLQLARTAYETAAKEQGLNRLTSLTDIELGVRHDTVFDWGDLQRDAMNAQTLAAVNQLEATVRAAGSNLRETYAAYRTAWDVCRHYRDEVLPLRRVIAEENLLRYNGMLIGVFELLADTRDQVHTVITAIEAQRDFWLADGALQAAVIGRPVMAPANSPPAAAGQDAPADH